MSIQDQIESLEKELAEKKSKLTELRGDNPRQPIKDFTFFDHDNQEVHLSDLFGNREELILIFNMGKGCPYCTLWADGYNGLTQHLENRAAFVVASPDTPDVQKEFSVSRKWKFRMVSHSNADFCKELGFYADHSYQPGVATFTKDEEGKVFLRAKTYFGPGDNFCIMWNFIDMLPESEKEWVPKYEYK